MLSGVQQTMRLYLLLGLSQRHDFPLKLQWQLEDSLWPIKTAQVFSLVPLDHQSRFRLEICHLLFPQG